MDSEKQHLESALTAIRIIFALKQRLTARVPKTYLFNPMCSRPARSPTDQAGLKATLVQYTDFMHYRYLPLPQHSSHKHHAESCPSCHSSKPQSPGGYSMHSRSCEGRGALVNTPPVRHRDALGAQSFCRKDLDQPPSPAWLCWHTYHGHLWPCTILAHPGGKSQGLCWRHGRHCPEEDAQHSFYPLQSNMKVLHEKVYSHEGQQAFSRSASQHMRSCEDQAFPVSQQRIKSL